MTVVNDSNKQWFVMRNLKRPNAKLPAYKQLEEAGFRVFTPMTTKIIASHEKRTRVQVPFINDLLFVFSEKDSLDKVVAKTETLQYRYVKGAPYCTPMVVPEGDMNRFIAAVTHVKTPKYYTLEEITPAMCGATVRMVCNGILNGLEGRLLKVRGSGKKRIMVELPGVLAAAIEVKASDYLEVLQN